MWHPLAAEVRWKHWRPLDAAAYHLRRHIVTTGTEAVGAVGPWMRKCGDLRCRGHAADEQPSGWGTPQPDSGTHVGRSRGRAVVSDFLMRLPAGQDLAAGRWAWDCLTALIRSVDGDPLDNHQRTLDLEVV